MKNRENNHDGTRPTYTGKTMCGEWKNSFTNFYDWAISNGYKSNLSIDRIDNNKGYEPSNCRWVDMKQQSRNRRNTRTITYKGETKPISEWCELLNLNYYTVISRLDRLGWSVERTLLGGDDN